ncbi:hypothetical protein BH18THE2_BH18THE2_25520 [soil metagenome]
MSYSKLQTSLAPRVSSFPDLNIYPAEGEGYPQIDDVTSCYDEDCVSKQDEE